MTEIEQEKVHKWNGVMPVTMLGGGSNTGWKAGGGE